MPPTPDPKDAPKASGGSARHWLVTLILRLVGLAAATVLSVAIVLGLALAMAFPNLPDISDLSDYRPKLPLRIY